MYVGTELRVCIFRGNVWNVFIFQQYRRMSAVRLVVWMDAIFIYIDVRRNDEA